MESSRPKSSRPSAGPQQRKLRNFLLDARFQLKYASYSVAITVFLCAALGTVLWRTSDRMVQESRKVTQVVEMTINQDPVYAELLGGDTGYRAELSAYQDRIKDQQRQYSIVLITGLALFVTGIGLASIVLTHKVAGPVYKLKRELKALGNGSLNYPVPIRKHDELQEVFETFNHAVGKLRHEQEGRVQRLDVFVDNVKDRLSEQEVAQLRTLQDELRRSLTA